MNLSLEGKKAIVCGSTDGIGKASAIMMAERGAKITLVARNENKLNTTMLELSQEQGQKHSFISVDFNNPDELKQKIYVYFDQVVYQVHIWVNNSGDPHGGQLIDAGRDEFRIVFERLLICYQVMARKNVPWMIELGTGRIINIISTSVRQVIPGLGVSNTIRGAVAQWAKTLALELGPDGITINNILPGYTNTDRLKELLEKWADNAGVSYDEMVDSIANKTSMRRIGEPQEIAYAVAFLASAAASYINSTDFSIDGGRFGA